MTTTRRADGMRTLDEHRIATEWAGASDRAIASILASARAAGGPMWAPDGTRATFLWRAPAGADPAAPVHLHVNRVTDKDRHADGVMAHVPGTPLHVRTLDLSPTLRASYGFTVGRGTRVQRGPRTGPAPTLLDPLNPLPPVVRDDGGQGLSVVRGPLSPPQPEWESPGVPAVLRGMVVDERLPLDAGPAGRPLRDCVLYLPAADDVSDLVPLLVLFDAEDWFGRMSLPRALEAAVSAGRMPPVAVLGVANPGRGMRASPPSAPTMLSSPRWRDGPRRGRSPSPLLAVSCSPAAAGASSPARASAALPRCAPPSRARVATAPSSPSRPPCGGRRTDVRPPST